MQCFKKDHFKRDVCLKHVLKTYHGGPSDYSFAIRLLRVLLQLFLLLGVVIVVLVSVGVDSIGLATRSRVAYAA